MITDLWAKNNHMIRPIRNLWILFYLYLVFSIFNHQSESRFRLTKKINKLSLPHEKKKEVTTTTTTTKKMPIWPTLRKNCNWFDFIINSDISWCWFGLQFFFSSDILISKLQIKWNLKNKRRPWNMFFFHEILSI